MLVTLAQKVSFLPELQTFLVPGPFPFSVLGHTTHLPLSFLAGPAFFPPSLRRGGSHFPATWSWHHPNPELGVGMFRIQVPVEEKHVQAVFCFGLFIVVFALRS